MKSLVSVILFICFLLISLFRAISKDFWGDESYCLSRLYDMGYGAIFLGMPGQRSPNSFYYLIEKFWIDLWGGTPQIYWNLLVFHRVFPALCWALGGVIVFLWVFHELTPIKNKIHVYGISIGASVFYATNEFGLAYAIESRPYAPWAFLTLCYLFFIRRILVKKSGSLMSVVYALTCFFLALTATPSAFILAAGTLTLIFLCQRKMEVSEVKFHVLVTAISVGTNILYLDEHGEKWTDYKTVFSFFHYCEVVGRVFLNTFHHNADHIYLAFTFPVFVLFIPYFMRKNRVFFGINAFCALVTASTFIVYCLIVMRGFYIDDRHIIYLIPLFSFWYFTGIYGAFVFLQSRFAFFRGIELSRLLFLTAMVFLAWTTPYWATDFAVRGRNFAAHSPFAKSSNDQCLKSQWSASMPKVNALHLLCR